MNFQQFFMGGDMGGGFPGGHPGMRQQQRREPVDTTKLYTILGVAKDCPQKDLRKAYLRKAQKEHPDKGGNAEKFKEIQKAYDILGTEEKRQIYDEYGEEGVENGGGGHDDMMSQFFGGGRRQQRGPQKSPSSKHEFPVSLEDLYKGKTTKIAVKKHAYELDPHGQYQTNRGQRMSRTMEKKKVDLTIDRGMMEGQKIVLTGEGDSVPGMSPGDTILVITEKKHPIFKRQGCDLVMTKKINLFEALSGTSFNIVALDGRMLTVKTQPGQCLQPGSTMQIKDEGMPVYRQPFTKGCIFVKFEVEFPEAVNIAQNDLAQLSSILGQTASASVVEAQDEDDLCLLEDIDMDAARERERTRSSYEPEEADEGPGQGGVQCQQS